jgi:hypothetical protein
VSLGFACESGNLRGEAVGFGVADIESHNRVCRQAVRSVATSLHTHSPTARATAASATARVSKRPST